MRKMFLFNRFGIRSNHRDTEYEGWRRAMSATVLTEEPSGEDGRFRQYLDRVKELIPSQVTAAFLAINSMIPLDSNYLHYLWWLFGALLFACAGYMFLQRASFWEGLFVTLIAFPVWALNIAVARFDSLADITFIPGCVLILVTVFSPLVPRRR